MKPYKKKFYRAITKEDITKLTEIKIKRISKYDSSKANDNIKGLEEEMKKVEYNLDHLIDYAIAYFKRIKAKYGVGRERKTEIRNFDNIEAVRVVATNQKLYVNRQEGFAGTGLKKDEYVCECSDIDDIIVFRGDGTFVVSKVAEKNFVGNDIIYINVFFKNDDRTIYNLIYQDGMRGNIMMKRFAVTGITRDKEYNLTKGTKGSKVLYFSANPNGEAEIISVFLRPKPKLKKLSFDMDFSELAIKGRNSIGNILTRHSVRKIIKKEEGFSTLGDLDIWYDESVMRLNTEKRGRYLGAFAGEDKILAIMSSGEIKVVGFDLASHFDEDMILIEKMKSKTIISSLFLDGETKHYYLKRFEIENSFKKGNIIPEHTESKLVFVSTDMYPRVELEFTPIKNKKQPKEIILISDFVGVKGIKAKGKKITDFQIEKIIPIEPLPYEDPEINLAEALSKDESADLESIAPSKSIEKNEKGIIKEKNSESFDKTRKNENIKKNNSKRGISDDTDDDTQMKLF